MTIPNLITKYQEKVAITKLQQTYSILSQGFRRMIAENGTVDCWGGDFSSRKSTIEDLLPSYIKILTEYPTGTIGLKIEPLGIQGVYNNDGEWVSFFPGNSRDYSTYALPNGVVIVFYMNGACIQDLTLSVRQQTDWGSVHYGTHGHACGSIQVAVNANSKIISNRDLFIFKIVKDGIVPAGNSKESVYTETFNDACLSSSKNSPGRGTAWVLENKNMDYLRCPEKLGWDKARSCNGK
jgi:hypothetical protein